MDSSQSEFDKLYYELMGVSPNKSGTAFEKIVNAALSIMEENEFLHDIHMKGASSAHHQIDGLSIDKKTVVESKDHTKSKKRNKVGLDEVQDLAGGLLDMPNVNKAYFASATSYTKDAEKYAEKSIDNSKSIILSNVQLSKEEDKKNRIGSILYRLTCLLDIKITPIFEESEKQKLFSENMIDEEKCDMNITEYYDENNNFYMSQAEMYDYVKKMKKNKGCFQFNGAIKFNDKFYRFTQIEYEKDSFTIEKTISSKSEPVIKISYQDKDKLLTAEQLKSKITQLEKIKNQGCVDNPE